MFKQSCFCNTDEMNNLACMVEKMCQTLNGTMSLHCIFPFTHYFCMHERLKLTRLKKSWIERMSFYVGKTKKKILATLLISWLLLCLWMMKLLGGFKTAARGHECICGSVQFSLIATVWYDTLCDTHNSCEHCLTTWNLSGHVLTVCFTSRGQDSLSEVPQVLVSVQFFLIWSVFFSVLRENTPGLQPGSLAAWSCSVFSSCDSPQAPCFNVQVQHRGENLCFVLGVSCSGKNRGWVGRPLCANPLACGHVMSLKGIKTYHQTNLTVTPTTVCRSSLHYLSAFTCVLSESVGGYEASLLREQQNFVLPWLWW